MSVAVKAQTARKAHLCDSCGRSIRPGARYLRHTMFPNHDLYDYLDPVTFKPLRRPVTGRECADCAERYGRFELLT